MKLRFEIQIKLRIEKGIYQRATTRPKSREQPMDTNVSATQRGNPAPGDGPQLAPK